MPRTQSAQLLRSSGGVSANAALCSSDSVASAWRACGMPAACPPEFREFGIRMIRFTLSEAASFLCSFCGPSLASRSS